MVWYITFFCQHEQSFMVVEKIVFWRVRIITFKVRSLAQSRSNETCYYNIYTVWPGFRIVTVFPFFSPLFRKNCGTRFFLSVIFFLSFFLSFFLFARGFTSFWKLVACTQSSERPQELHTRGSYLSVRHQILIFLHEYDNDSPSPWTCLLTKSWSDVGPPCKQKKGPVFHGRARGNDDSRGWLEQTRLPDEFETSLTILVCPEGGRVVSGSIL